MGQVKILSPVKLISAFIFQKEDIYAESIVALTKRFGQIDFESKLLPFDQTDYYRDEFGSGLLRKFVSFAKLIPADSLAEIKLFSNRIEKELSKEGKRRINIDPGYLDLAKLVLASTKDYNHRIYIGSGIFAEITLYFRDKSYKPWEWTYRDYCTPEYAAVFNEIREIYRKQIT